MLLQTHDIVTIVTAVAIMLLVVVLSLLHIESGSRWYQLHRARRYLALASAVIAITGILGIILGRQNVGWELVSSSTFFVGMIQATIFTYICIWMVHPEFRGRMHIIVMLLVCAIVGGVAVALSVFSPEDYDAWRWVWSGAFAGQMVEYCMLFAREYRAGKQHIDNEYEDDISYRVRWIRRCFLGALAVGIGALVFASVPMSLKYFDCFMVAYTIYYIYIGICVINYRTRGAFIVRVADVSGSEEVWDVPMAAANALTIVEDGSSAVGTHVGESAPTSLPEVHTLIEKRLAQWTKAGLYLCSDIPMDDIAGYMGVTRRQLSAYFAEELHMQFRTWRNTKRIDYARARIESDSEVSISSLPNVTGFTNASNFYAEFKKQTGMTPSEYRAKFHAVSTR